MNVETLIKELAQYITESSYADEHRKVLIRVPGTTNNEEYWTSDFSVEFDGATGDIKLKLG